MTHGENMKKNATHIVAVSMIVLLISSDFAFQLTHPMTVRMRMSIIVSTLASARPTMQAYISAVRMLQVSTGHSCARQQPTFSPWS